MVLKHSGHVTNTIFLLYKQKTGWNSDIWNFFSEQMDVFLDFVFVFVFVFQFRSIFTENPLFEFGHVWKRHCDVIHWPIFMILVSMERRDPTLYYGTKQLYFGPVNFKFIGGGKPCYKKGLVGLGLVPYFNILVSYHAPWFDHYSFINCLASDLCSAPFIRN